MYIEARCGDSTYRIYAITRKNKLLGGTLALVIVIELCSGTFSIAWVALSERKSLSFVSVVCKLIGLQRNRYQR